MFLKIISVFCFLISLSLFSNEQLRKLTQPYNYSLELGQSETEFISRNPNFKKTNLWTPHEQIYTNDMVAYMVDFKNIKRKNRKNDISIIMAYFYKGRLALVSIIYQDFENIKNVVSYVNNIFGAPSYSKKMFLGFQKTNLVNKWVKDSYTVLLDHRVGVNNANIFVSENKNTRRGKRYC